MPLEGNCWELAPHSLKNCQRRRLITTEGSGKYRKAHVKTFSQHVCNGMDNSVAEMLCRYKALLRRTRESWGMEGIGVNECLCVWMSEWTSRWKYRPSHWIFYFLQYERWDSPLCSLLLSLFQVLRSTSWKLMKIFLFSKFILFHWSLLLLLRIVLY